MYKKLGLTNNNIKEDDIIKSLENMISFVGGIGVGLLYKKYEKDISKYMKKASKKMED